MLAATALAVALFAADAAPPIVIDGSFTDWTAAQPALRDPADNPAGPVDIGAVTVVDDAAFLDILVELGRSANLQRLDGRLMLVIDADGDASTGMTQYDLPGTDAVVVFTPADTRDETRPGAGVAVRLPGPEAESVSPYDWGIMFAPTYASDRAEVRLQRGAVLSGRGPLLVGDKAVLRFVVIDRSGTVRDTTDPIVHTFATPFAAPTPAAGGADPLARPSGTDVRVLSWNGELGAFFSRPEHFARVIKAANPDILCFQELKDDASAEKLTAWLNEHIASEKPWTCVFGAGGGNLRTAVASRLPLKPVESFDRVTYRNASGAERDVRAALALVEVNGRQLLAASIHLKCCGSAG
ncbi:MAG: hypothetical protein KDA22_10810, partial [Phycisphaerales bacterium]|nr:hypothetical protein [Phycisphaerales bacterium]